MLILNFGRNALPFTYCYELPALPFIYIYISHNKSCSKLQLYRFISNTFNSRLDYLCPLTAFSLYEKWPFSPLAFLFVCKRLRLDVF